MTRQSPILVFAVASLAAVALGAAVCAMSGVPNALWIRNLAAWAVGGVAAVGLARFAGRRMAYAALLAGPLGLAATMLSPAQDGVHRWLDIGPLHINAAMLLLPSFVVATAVVAERAKWWWAPAILALAVLALQPDASQASALATAVCAIAVRRRGAILARVAPSLAAVALAGVAWTRPDPLQPVAEVEEIVQLAASHSPLLAALAVAVLAAFSAVPALTTRGGEARIAGLALAALFLGWSVAPALGAFPVPLVGVGLSPILGAWLGVGLLAALRRTARA